MSGAASASERVASTDDTETKRRRVDNATQLGGLSRREQAPTAKPTSTYGDMKQKPAWFKGDEDKNMKYEKYGERSNIASTSYASERAETSGVSTYQRRGEEQDSRLNRLKRARETIERDSSPRREQQHQGGGGDVVDDDDEGEDESIQPYLHLDVANPSTTRTRTDNYHTFHSRIKDKESGDINSIVRQHYNQRTQQSKRQGPRTSSPIYKLRNFNNTIKYILLGNWAKHDPESSPLFSILDLCCGKGGDLNKCEFLKIDQYIGIDISDLSVREAFDRYSRQKARFKPRNGARADNRYNYEACFATGDCFTQYVPDILEPNFPGIIEKTFPVDVVSTQFALHYAFESEDKVHTLLTNVSKSLRVGGRFIGTIPSSDFIKSKIVDKQYYRDANTGKIKLGNGLYSATFDKEPPEDGVFRPPFGNRYSYWLKDAVDDVPEYVVPFEILRAICEEHNLVLKYKKNFIDIFNQEIPRYFGKLNKNLIDGLRRSDGKYGAEGEEKEAVGFYIGFVFEKVG
ncbi:ABD1 [Candida theae]|uniref:mRNA cap guanine-N(7) methyltransferase n=1 Tax=Candida theae TaxID=1198502 RepID=A0AAD5BK21_9ASCO|nr:ABD1 [Candida theae]KAI5968929.1 ABD1 [Candida theae]